MGDSRRGAAEAIEAIAHGDERSSKVVGRAIRDINLPPGTSIGAIVRGDGVIIGHDDVIVESDDHVILFLADKRHVAIATERANRSARQLCRVEPELMRRP